MLEDLGKTPRTGFQHVHKWGINKGFFYAGRIAIRSGMFCMGFFYAGVIPISRLKTQIGPDMVS
jgi:hypothetical protein